MGEFLFTQGSQGIVGQDHQQVHFQKGEILSPIMSKTKFLKYSIVQKKDGTSLHLITSKVHQRLDKISP